MTTNINPRLKKAFEKYIEEENKPKTYGSYGSSYVGGSYGGTYNYPSTCDCTIFFYEWSNLKSGAKHFKTKVDFFNYLDECKISYTPKQKSEIEAIKYKNVFATCIPSKAELMTADTWYQLNNAVVALTKPTTPTVNTITDFEDI